MTLATAILWLIAVVLFIYAWKKGPGTERKGLAASWKITKRNALLLFVAFLIVGYIDVLSPQALVEKYIGPNSGWSGLLLAEGIGMLLPGGPYVIFPLIKVIYDAGAGIGPVITIITSWSLLALLSLSFELSFMGWRFSVVRWGLGLLVPFLLGILLKSIIG